MSTSERLITDHLDTWSSAIKEKPSAGRGGGKKEEFYGIKKLRELILELASRGLLVPQDPNDEPASALLKKVAAEESRLVKAEAIRKRKKAPEINENEKPFVLPSSWAWIRLAEAGHDWGQKAPESDFTYIDVGSINKEQGIVSNPNVLSAAEAPSRARKIVKEGTVIYSTVRPYLLNIAVVSDSLDPEPIASTAFAIIHPFTGIEASFLYRYLRSPAFINYVESCQTGIAYPAINDKQFFSGVLPLPPLAEQQRIVAKVDELMALCDQLEQQQEDSVRTHRTLVQALLGALTAASERGQFGQAWQRIESNFDTLFTTENSIDQLKKAILEIAVTGKLVEHDPDNEPAILALNKAIKSKHELGVDREIRKDKEAYTASTLFNIPESWKWVCIGSFCHVLGGKRVPRGYALLDTPTPYVYIRVTDMKNGTVLEDDLKYIGEDIFQQISKYIVNKEDVYVTIAGTIGATGSIPESLDGMNLTENAAKLVFRHISQAFVIRALSSNYCQDQFAESVNQMAQPKLSLASIKKTSIAIPPLAEQHCIVARVDALMTLCDSLKASLQTAQATRLKLADSLVEAAIH